MILCRPVKMNKFLAQGLINVSKNVGHFDWPTKKMFQFKSSKMSRYTNICKGGKYQYKQIFARLLFTIVLSPKPPNISTYERFGTYVCLVRNGPGKAFGTGTFQQFKNLPRVE